MNVIKFPGLNLIVNVPQFAFEVVGIKIYNYALCIVLGIIVALILCKISKNKFDIEFDDVLEYMIYALILGIVGARLYYVVFNFRNYSNDLLQILNFRDGGLAIYGGLIFGAITLILILKIKKKNILDFFDRIVGFVAIAQAIGRWGNFFNVEAYGYNTNNILRMGIVKQGIYSEVHPMFLYESMLNFILFFVLIKIQKNRKYKGQVLLYYLAGYSLFRGILESLRIDSLMLGSFRVSQVLSIIIFIVVSLIIILKNRKDNIENK